MIELGAENPILRVTVAAVETATREIARETTLVPEPR